MNDTEFAALDFKLELSDEMITETVEYLLSLDGEKFLSANRHVGRGAVLNAVRMFHRYPALMMKLVETLKPEHLKDGFWR